MAHPARASSPTRRSSDLALAPRRPLLVRTLGDLVRIRVQPVAAQEIQRGPVVSGQRLHQLRRSEEHTSELQSHVNIVCRLLLAKKEAIPPAIAPNINHLT